MVPMNQKDTTFTKIFVGGLPYHTTDETLRRFFERFGEIDEAVVITDRATGKSRGYGFVTMATKEAAQEAIKDPNPMIDGRKANVNLAYLGAKPRNAVLSNAAAAAAAANTVIHLGAAYPGLQTYGLQPLIYPTHTLLGSNVLGAYPTAAGAGSNALNALSQSTLAAHYAAAAGYDFASQFGAATGGASQQNQGANGGGQSAAANQAAAAAALEAAVAAANFQYGAGAPPPPPPSTGVNSAASPAALAAAAAAAAAASNPNAGGNPIANYAYAALAQQALPSLTAAAAYQQ